SVHVHGLADGVFEHVGGAERVALFLGLRPTAPDDLGELEQYAHKVVLLEHEAPFYRAAPVRQAPRRASRGQASLPVGDYTCQRACLPFLANRAGGGRSAPFSKGGAGAPAVRGAVRSAASVFPGGRKRARWRRAPSACAP